MDADKNLDSLIETAELARRLDDSNLRIFDATIHFESGGTTRSGLADWEAGHIPGSRFVDLLTEFSEPDIELHFTRPTPERLDRILGQLGIATDSQVVVYSAAPGSTMWATRLWWLLRSAGIDNVALLDGSFAKWKAEGRAISVEPCRYVETIGSSGQADESWWATQEEVLAAVGDGAVCTLNALPRALFTGEIEMGYSRPGRITGSQNAPFTGVLDPESGMLRSQTELRAHFSMLGAAGSERVISYCGGGIAATLNGFALRRLGYSNIGVYDGSLNEWSRNPKLPMEVGE
jgi:thiosulfate/3-mercaptopyruvate sulfurtransferase